MSLENLHDLYLHSLKDLYSAETQIRAGFEEHLRQTEGQVKRLDKIFERLGEEAGDHHCKGMEGLLEEGEEVMKERADQDVLDAALIAAAQRVEHYEIAGYGCARTYANMLGFKEDADLLQQTLDEEGATDKKLTDMAESVINVHAMN
jgi:ferritin-like metal-binding protein YciE